MSITTYDELKTAAANWLDKTNLTSRIPEFIALAEAKINRELRVRQMETRSTMNTVAGQRYYALPTGFLSLRNIQLNLSPIQLVNYAAPEWIDAHDGGDSGNPIVYTLVGGEFQLYPVPDAVYELEISYIKAVTALSDSATTNWLLTSHPDVYLYGTLLEAEPYLKNKDGAQVWAAGFSYAIDSINKLDRHDRWPGSSLRQRVI